MNEDLSKRRLGRGLAALIGEIDRPRDEGKQTVSSDGRLPIEHIRPNPRNPRRNFAEADLADLAQSIREHGIVQPVVVRPAAGGSGYEIIAGERRWRAAQRAGLTDIPVIVRPVDDRVALELAIVENVQRSDLNAIEEALGYHQLLDEHNYTQAELGDVIGKSRSHVANTLRLLKLPADVRDLISDGALSAGHARTLVTAADPSAAARRIVDEGLSVRQAELLAQAKPDGDRKSPGGKPRRDRDTDTEALEKVLSDATGLEVRIKHRDKGGEVRVLYKSLEQLDEISRLLRK